MCIFLDLRKPAGEAKEKTQSFRCQDDCNIKDNRKSVMAKATATFMSKLCQTCGRQISPRAKWAKNWEEIRYCSDSCRHHRPNAIDLGLESTALSMLRDRSGKTVTCEEVETQFLSERSSEREVTNLRERARRAARRLVMQDRIAIEQKGQIVDPSFAKGVMNLRLTNNVAAQDGSET